MTQFAQTLHSRVPISQFSKGQAVQVFDRLRSETKLIVLKNNAPAAVLLSCEEYERLAEVEENWLFTFSCGIRGTLSGRGPFGGEGSLLATLSEGGAQVIIREVQR